MNDLIDCLTEYRGTGQISQRKENHFPWAQTLCVTKSGYLPCCGPGVTSLTPVCEAQDLMLFLRDSHPKQPGHGSEIATCGS